MEENNLDLIKGAKSSPSPPTTAPDSLDSLATAKILDAICEGEIEGFVTPSDEGVAFGSSNYHKYALKDIYLDDVPIVNEFAEFDTTTNTFEEEEFNFDNVTVDSRIGRGNQGVMGGFQATRVEETVNSGNIVQDTPIVQQVNISNHADADQIAITINVPALQKFDDDGDIVNVGVTFRIEYKIEGGTEPDAGYVTPFPQGYGGTGNRHIAGRTPDPFQKQYIFNLPAKYKGTGATYLNLRVTRISPNATTRSQSDIQWFSYQIITFDKTNTYPNTALIGFQVSSEEFRSIPRRYFRLRGKIVAVPKGVYTDNQNPTDPDRAGRLRYNSSANWTGGTSLTNNGTLRSTWQRLYTNDPAFCLYDLLINERYGLNLPESALDQFSFWNISQYNNELVPDQRDSAGSINGTWELNANKTEAIITSPSDHKYSGGDLISVTFTSGTSGIAPATQGTAVVYKIRRINRKKFAAKKVNPNSVKISGNCTFGRVGLSPRFSFNHYINRSYKAYDLVNAICSNMRVMPYWDAGTLRLHQDKPAEQVNGGAYSPTADVLPAYIFTESNVIDGNFTYEGSDIKNRATLVIAKYYDNQQRKVSYEQFPSQAVIGNTTIGNVSTTISNGGDVTIAKYGILKKFVDGFGITDSSQAQRLAKWTRETEQLLTQTVTFSVAIDAGVILRTGQVIAISDSVKSGVRRGGKILGVTGTNKITVDSTANFPNNNVNYTRTINVLMPDGTVNKKTISDITGNEITISGNFKMKDADGNLVNTAPNVFADWTLETSGGTEVQNLQNQLYRVLVVTEEEKIKYKVTALIYNHSIYNAVETGNSVKFRDATNLRTKPKRPANLKIVERLYKFVVNNENNNKANQIQIRSKLIINWSQVADVSRYELRILQPNGFERKYEVQGLSFEIPTVAANRTYKFRVFSISDAGGLLSHKPKETTYTTVGQTEPPNDVKALFDDGTAAFSVTATNSDAGNLINFVENEPNPDFSSGANTLEDNNTNPKVQFKDLDIAYYEIHKTNQNFSNSQINQLFGNKNNPTFVGRPRSPNLQTREFLSENYTYYIKARDRQGRYSLNATSAVFTYVAPSPPVRVADYPKLENGMVLLTWSPPSTNSSYAIKKYIINDGAKNINVKSNVTEYKTPLNFIGSKTFKIYAVDMANVSSNKLEYKINVPEPSFGNNDEIDVEITLDSIVLSWPSVENTDPSYDAPNNVQQSQIPEITGYRVTTNHEDAQVDGLKNLFPITVRDTEIEIPITAQNINKTGTALVCITTFKVNPVYQRADLPQKGIISNSQITRTINFTRPTPPTLKNPSYIFTQDQVRLRWQKVADGFTDNTNVAIFKIIKYGIYDNSTPTKNLLFETDATEINIDVDFAANNSNMSKTYNIAALDTAYVNSPEAIKHRFQGQFRPVTVTVTKLDAPQAPINQPAYKLGNEGGLGFVTIKYRKPTKSRTANLGLKDYRIIRSTRTTFNNAWNTGNDSLIELETFTNAQSFKEEVSWTIASGGQRYYYVQARDINDNLSDPLKITATINLPNTPKASGTSEVIDNNVLLRWDYGTTGNPPTKYSSSQLRVKEFEIRKHKSTATDPEDFSTATLIGRVDGVFNVVFEQEKDIYTYHIAAIDTAGNMSPSFKVVLSVAQPPDFVLNDNHFSDFTTTPSRVFGNTLTNCFLYDSKLFIPVNTTETWAEHFIGTGSVSSPQFNNMNALINANPTNLNYLEPAPAQGSYEEKYDYGNGQSVELASTKITAIQTGVGRGSGSIQNQGIINTARDVSPIVFTDEDNTSGNDGITQNGTSFFRFGTNFRYVKYKVIVNSTNGKYREINTLNLILDTKILNDTGTGTANASDSGGTQVNFNADFVDVQGITVTPNVNAYSTDNDRRRIAVVDFVDSPNPTFFKVFLFNANGDRVSGKFTWNCRGT